MNDLDVQEILPMRVFPIPHSLKCGEMRVNRMMKKQQAMLARGGSEENNNRNGNKKDQNDCCLKIHQR